MTTTTLPTSDLPMPTTAEILTVIVEQRADAVLYRDTPTITQLDRVIVALVCGARAWWQDGDLHVTSVNSPGVIYVLSCGLCDCPATKPCWHGRLLDILLGMQDTLVGDADFEADADELALLLADDDDGESGAPAAAPTPITLAQFPISSFILQRFGGAPVVADVGEADLFRQGAPAQAHLGQRLTRARRVHPAYAPARPSAFPNRPLFAARDAEDARRAALSEERAQLLVLRAQPVQQAAAAINELF